MALRTSPAPLPITIPTDLGFKLSAVFRTRERIGTPEIGCRTFGVSDFMRVPSPAARIKMEKSFFILSEAEGRVEVLRGMDSNHEWEIQSLLCYHYTTPESDARGQHSATPGSLLGNPLWFPSNFVGASPPQRGCRALTPRFLIKRKRLPG